MKDHTDQVLHTVCPFCLRENDLVTDLTSDEPMPYEGALSLCIRCGRFAFFTGDLTLRRPTKSEQWEMDNDVELAKVRWAWKQSGAGGQADGV